MLGTLQPRLSHIVGLARLLILEMRRAHANSNVIGGSTSFSDMQTKFETQKRDTAANIQIHLLVSTFLVCYPFLLR